MTLRRRGQVMVVTDVTTDSRFDRREARVASGVRSAVTVALVKDCCFVGDFGVQSAAPRDRTASEVALPAAVSLAARHASDGPPPHA